MVSQRTVNWVERLVWILVYGGLFTAIVGGVARREDDALGLALLVVGAAAVVVGVVLIVVRSRLSSEKPLARK